MKAWMNKSWFIPVLLTVVLLVAGLFYTQFETTGEERMKPAEFSEQLEEMYGSEVISIVLSGDEYVANMERVDGEYEVRADAQYGNIITLELISPNESTSNTNANAPSESTKLQQDETTNQEEQPEQDETQLGTSQEDKEDSKPIEEQPSTSTRITESEAIEIARTQVSGTVEDVDFESSDSGGYYLVEIEQPPQGDDDDGPEATVQIHAITGKVISVVWDD